MTPSEVDELLRGKSRPTLDQMLDVFDQAIAEDKNEEASTKVIVTVGVALIREVIGKISSIDESLKSIAASQAIIAEEAAVSKDLLEEGASSEPETTQAADWTTETL